LLDDATHPVHCVELLGTLQSSQLAWQGRQWPVALAAVPALHASRHEPSEK